MYVCSGDYLHLNAMCRDLHTQKLYKRNKDFLGLLRDGEGRLFQNFSNHLSISAASYYRKFERLKFLIKKALMFHPWATVRRA
jgi:hypothetical protein